MSRVKRGIHHIKRRRNILKRVKGFQGGRKKLLKLAKTADTKAGAHSYRDRKRKKRTARTLWQVKINAAARTNGTSYSRLLAALKKQGVELNRKSLAEIAETYPLVFDRLVTSLIHTKQT